MTDNLTIFRGQHLITVGTHNEFFKLRQPVLPGRVRRVGFRERRLARGGARPYRYEIALPLRPDGPMADFKVKQLGGYVQDVWSATPRLSLTPGLRARHARSADKPTGPARLADAARYARHQHGRLPERRTCALVAAARLQLRSVGRRTARGSAAASASSAAGRRTCGCRTPTATPACEQATLICDGATSGPATPTRSRRSRSIPRHQPDHCGGRRRGTSAAARRSSTSTRTSSSRRP